VLYAFTSAAANNGSAFAGLTANSPFYNTSLGSRCWSAASPHRADAGGGGLARREEALAPSAGTLPTHTPLFVGLLVGVILIVGGLTFFPALALGPVVEHLALLPALSDPDDGGGHDAMISSSPARRAASSQAGRSARHHARPADPLAPPSRARSPSSTRATGRNPVMFVVEVVQCSPPSSPCATAPVLRAWASRSRSGSGFWFTLVFANVAEAVAARAAGKAQRPRCPHPERDRRPAPALRRFRRLRCRPAPS
jgi:hypothetical protein